MVGVAEKATTPKPQNTMKLVVGKITRTARGVLVLVFVLSGGVVLVGWSA